MSKIVRISMIWLLVLVFISIMAHFLVATSVLACFVTLIENFVGFIYLFIFDIIVGFIFI